MYCIKRTGFLTVPAAYAPLLVNFHKFAVMSHSPCGTDFHTTGIGAVHALMFIETEFFLAVDVEPFGLDFRKRLPILFPTCAHTALAAYTL